MVQARTAFQDFLFRYPKSEKAPQAKENLAKLNRLCWFGCEEERDLKEAIAHAPKG